jgi:hypothetical protein
VQVEFGSVLAMRTVPYICPGDGPKMVGSVEKHLSRSQTGGEGVADMYNPPDRPTAVPVSSDNRGALLQTRCTAISICSQSQREAKGVIILDKVKGGRHGQ